MKTRILKVPLAGKDESALGRWATTRPDGTADLNTWEVPSSSSSSSSPSPADNNDDPLEPLREAAHLLRTTATPVAFPTETVYGLGADATRSAAVRGIYSAKGRPSDNPLIVHVSDLAMLRRLLLNLPSPSSSSPGEGEGEEQGERGGDDPIPAIYHPLITRFWPGPLTILLPLPSPSPLAPEVTATQRTFGARMPASALARSLIALACAPLAAPSANASTRPSPTTAQHVRDDLDGKIELVLDGGACAVGVESTVVDGLCDPPVVLRPGGVGIEELRRCPGWEGVVKAYRDRVAAEGGREGEEEAAPRAPGMKYKHYSPRARVVLFESGGDKVGDGDEVRTLVQAETQKKGEKTRAVGVIRTGRWPVAGGLECSGLGEVVVDGEGEGDTGFVVKEGQLLGEDGTETAAARLLDVDLGGDVKGVAHGLFAALRELDRRGADVIFVEGVNDGDGIAAAVMNRLRKAASDIRT
ncbi:DHBP synthase RibB-like alpha/beta domain-containing protein [Chaetomium strumarium]|uniref:Threonylcarbamoyl-AMP synthase n=1 Tax=Chaetomium strumarium TaxID=1170767 RepID=A0AAJ0M6I2_9PEZI|nr:DHBP synthase RibB-like alpha/beta domain-containing protein [Chaetomium strumarium]